MGISEAVIALIDNGGRRLGVDRRQFSYTSHIPNRRFNKDRRVETDRRGGEERRSGLARRGVKGILIKFKIPENDLRKTKDRRNELDRRVACTASQ